MRREFIGNNNISTITRCSNMGQKKNCMVAFESGSLGLVLRS